MTKFVVDSSGDNIAEELIRLDEKQYNGLQFEVVPLTLYNDQEEFVDDEKLKVSDMLDKMEKYSGRSYTSCPSTGVWLNAFEGADEIFVVTITSGLSGTYNSAMVAKDTYLQEHPEAKVEVFDSLSAGPGLRIILEKLVEEYQMGHSFEEITQNTRAYMKKAHTFFSLQSLHNLAENGRVNKLVAKAVGVLGISILGEASKEGTIEPIAKTRGTGKMIKALMERLEKADYAGGKVRICHVENPGLAQEVIDTIQAKYGKIDALCYSARGLCSFYAERGGIILSIECNNDR